MASQSEIMIEFKFSCPNCGQHIQCNDAYCGLQIICPTCQNQIIVPPPPAAIPQNIPTSTPTKSTTAPAQRTTALPSEGKQKSKSKLLVVAGAVGGLLIAGAIGYVFISRSSTVTAPEISVTKPVSPKPIAPKPSEPVATAVTVRDTNTLATTRSTLGSTSQTSNAAEIMRKVTERYDSLTSLSARGKAISIIDRFGGAGANQIDATRDVEREKAIGKTQRIEIDFSVKIARPNLYRVEWDGQFGTAKRKGAVWSAGDGDFLRTETGQTRYIKMKTRALALASAAGTSGGAASTLPQIFFRGQSSLLALFTNAVRDSDEILDGENCYVVSGNAMGMKVVLWIDPETFLIKQKQQVLGGDMEIPQVSDAKMEEGLKQLGSNLTDEQKAQVKEAMKKMTTRSSQMKATTTETYTDIEINPPLAKSDFDYEFPAGTTFNESF